VPFTACGVIFAQRCARRQDVRDAEVYTREHSPRGDTLKEELYLPDILHSPDDFLLAFLFASTLALGACLWLVWSEMRSAARREQRRIGETESYLHQQLAALNEKLNGEMARQKSTAEQAERTLETSVRRRLDELQGLIESLRVLEARLQARVASPTSAAPQAADQSPAATAPTTAKEARGGLSVIGRPPKTGGA
jgi:hypothetical protein